VWSFHPAVLRERDARGTGPSFSNAVNMYRVLHCGIPLWVAW
jgi:hypothetical protein